MISTNSGIERQLSQPGQRAERRSSPSLAAYHWIGANPRPGSVRNISSTGAYVVTQERWNPGEVVSLTLQRVGPPEKTPERRIAVQARAVRWGEDGIAVSFVLPPGADLRLWQSPLKSAAEQNEPEDILREFRTSAAIAFLHRICPSSTDEVRRLLHEGLSNYRLESAVEIALKAEKMLASAIDTDNLHANRAIVMRIVESGSWAEDLSNLQYWAGLLASSCTSAADDQTNLAYVDLLSQLNSIHVRILAAACTKGSKAISGLGRISSRPISWSAAELIKITGCHDLIKIERDIEHLSELGLLETRQRSTFFSPIAESKITPTSVGLELYARCNGHRGMPQGFYGLATPISPLLANEV